MARVDRMPLRPRGRLLKWTLNKECVTLADVEFRKADTLKGMQALGGGIAV